MVFVRKGLVCVVAVAAMSGCFTYSPISPADAVLETRVRATVNAAQTEQLAAVLRSATPQVVGTLVERDAESVMLEVPLWGATASSRAVHNRVSIPVRDIVSLESRTFSAWRTAVSVGVVVAAVAGSWAFIGGGDKIDDKQKTDVDAAVVPLFSIPFTIFP